MEEARFSLMDISEVERNEKSLCHTWTSEGLVPGHESSCLSNHISWWSHWPIQRRCSLYHRDTSSSSRQDGQHCMSAPQYLLPSCRRKAVLARGTSIYSWENSVIKVSKSSFLKSLDRSISLSTEFRIKSSFTPDVNLENLDRVITWILSSDL